MTKTLKILSINAALFLGQLAYSGKPDPQMPQIALRSGFHIGGGRGIGLHIGGRNHSVGFQIGGGQGVGIHAGGRRHDAGIQIGGGHGLGMHAGRIRHHSHYRSSDYTNTSYTNFPSSHQNYQENYDAAFYAAELNRIALNLSHRNSSISDDLRQLAFDLADAANSLYNLLRSHETSFIDMQMIQNSFDKLVDRYDALISHSSNFVNLNEIEDCFEDLQKALD